MSKLNELSDFFNEWDELTYSLFSSIYETDDESLNERLNAFNKKVENNERLLLVCHDYKGNYLKQDTDSYTDIVHKKGCNGDGFPFTFPGMSYTDIFIYFSHKFIALPCKKWVDKAHLHGKLALGTLLVEHKGEKQKLYAMLNDPYACDKIALLLKHKNVDGILLNIEVSLDETYSRKMLEFVEKLRHTCNQRFKNDIPIIWYDAVTVDGKLDHQCAVNKKNGLYFVKSKFIFLDYKWKLSNWKKTKKYVASLKESSSFGNDQQIRFNQVFFGVDLFARHTPSYKEGVEGLLHAMNQIPDTSIAVFAPGYCHEKSDSSIDCNLKIMNIWVDFFLNFKPEMITIKNQLSFGPPYEKYMEDLDGTVVYKERTNHIFPLFPNDKLFTFELYGNRLEFTRAYKYQILYCPCTMMINVRSNIKNGYAELRELGGDNTVKILSNQIEMFAGEYSLWIVPDEGKILELYDLILDPVIKN